MNTTIQVVLWVATAIMTLGLLVFLLMTFQTRSRTKHFYYITSLVALIAATSYFAMATGHGLVFVGNRPFYFARYVDWVFTTPLLLLDLALLAIPRVRERIGLIGILVGADIYMIITGLISGFLNGPDKYVWFATSTIAFFAILYYLIQLFNDARDRGPQVSRLFSTLSALTIVLWICYPIVWLLGTEGAGIISLAAEVVIYAVLDVLAKIGFGFLLLSNRAALTEATEHPREATYGYGAGAIE